MPKEEFIGMVTADQPEAPAYFSYDAMLNKTERPTLDDTLERALKPLSLRQVLQLVEKGAQLLDVRDPADFAGAHLAGSFNIGLGGAFATWSGTILSRSGSILIIAEPGRENEAAMRLGRIGFDHVGGYLENGMQALEGRPDLVSRTERVTAATLAEQLSSLQQPLILDVRSNMERQQKAIEGSQHIPLNHLEERVGEVPRDRKAVVHCATGYRSSIAVSILERSGAREIADLVGGIAAWEASRLETVSAGSQ